MILVTGATGTVGTELVKALAAQGAPVRALVHTPAKAATLAGPGVEIVAGDYLDAASLDAALVGVNHVFLLAPPAENQVAMETGVIAAAQRAGVEHVVKLAANGLSLDSPVALLRNHATIAETLRTSGLGWTLLVANEFMQNLLAQAAAIKAGTLYMPLGEGKVSLIDTRDVALAAAALLTQPGHQGKSYLVTGPAALSMQDVADILTQVLGRKISYVAVSPEAAQEALLGMGLPAWLVEQLLGLMAGWAAGNSEPVTTDFRQITGQEPRAFIQFVHDYAAVWGG
ncbi:MAG TPA: SDR family oxidoreductase [Armatimonadota bacterium]|jgi:uncharacterized protein YbjT (DUF2867 family)